MKKLSLFLAFCAMAVTLAAAADIWNERVPVRKRPQTRNPNRGYGSVAILPRGPKYGPAEPSRVTGNEPGLNEIQQMVQEQSGASPDGLVQKATTNQDPCQGNPGLAAMQSLVQEFMAKAQALIAKLQAFNAEAARLNAGINSCCRNYANPSCVSCINSWNAQISAHNAQLPALMAEVTALYNQALALQGQYTALLTSSPCRSGMTQPAPAGQSLGNFARRLGVRVPGASGSGSGSFGTFRRDFGSMAGMSEGWGEDFSGNFDSSGGRLRPFERREFEMWKFELRTIDFWKVNMRPFELEQGRFQSLQLQAAALERARQAEEAKAAADKKARVDAAEREYHAAVQKKLDAEIDDLTPHLSGSAESLRVQSLKIAEPPPPQVAMAPADSEEGKGMWDKAKENGEAAGKWLITKAWEKAKEKVGEKIEEAGDKLATAYLGQNRAEALKKIVKTEQGVFERLQNSYETAKKMVADPSGDWNSLQQEDDANTGSFVKKWSDEVGAKPDFFGSGS